MDFKENEQRDRKVEKNKSFIESLGFALEGIVFAFQEERNFRFQVAMTILVIVLGIFFKLSRYEWIAILFCCVLVLMGELINTSMEWLVDLVTMKNYHLGAKRVKDIAAGISLIAALFSVIIGALIFIPHIMIMFGLN